MHICVFFILFFHGLFHPSHHSIPAPFDSTFPRFYCVPLTLSDLSFILPCVALSLFFSFPSATQGPFGFPFHFCLILSFPSATQEPRFGLVCSLCDRTSEGRVTLHFFFDDRHIVLLHCPLSAAALVSLSSNSLYRCCCRRRVVPI